MVSSDLFSKPPLLCGHLKHFRIMPGIKAVALQTETGDCYARFCWPPIITVTTRESWSSCGGCWALGNPPAPFVIPTVAEGPAVPRTILGNVFRQSPTVDLILVLSPLHTGSSFSPSTRQASVAAKPALPCGNCYDRRLTKPPVTTSDPFSPTESAHTDCSLDS